MTITTPNASQRSKPLYRGTMIVWYILLALEILLAFRFILKLFAANPNAGFTKFIIAITSIFADPFFNVFGTSKLAGSAFEWTTLLAMLVYAIIALLIVKLLVLSRPVSTEEATAKLPKQEKI